MRLLIKGGNVHDGLLEKPYVADILICDGKIEKIAPEISLPQSAKVFDVTGMDVYPGFIDAHTHIGMFGFGGTATKDDVEKYQKCTPAARAIDAINPMEPSFLRGCEAGVTTVCIAPGSVNCMGGTAVAVKTYGKCIDKMVVKDPVAMKIAFGENPKAKLNDKLTSRATIATAIREMLFQTREYQLKKESGMVTVPDRRYEALLPVLEKKIPLKAHAHRCDDIFTAIRIAREFDLRLTLEHVSDCEPIVKELAQTGYPIAVGPYFYQPQKSECQNGHPSVGVALVRAGASVSVMTDSPIVAEEYLPLSAGLLMREGLSEFEALQTITINPARHLGIEDRVGSLQEGKDADIVICKGCPMEIRVKPSAVLVNGVLVGKERLT